MRSLYILFVHSGFSKKLYNKIAEGKIDAIIYCKPNYLINLKKMFQKEVKGKFKIIPYDAPYNMNTFNYLLTSRSFWDEMDIAYRKVVVVNNPFNMNLEIKVKNHKPFRFYAFTNQSIDFTEFPILEHEKIKMGFIMCIERKFAINTLSRFSKSNIISLRKELKMKNTEELERALITPFYCYFYHYYLTLGYDN